MERFAIQELKKWKENPARKPLVLMGARQVGKTWLMRDFGERYYENVAYISFYNNNAIKKVFDSDYDIDRILSYLNIEVGFKIQPEKTLIIFDEIQNAPKAFESLKYFCEEAPDYHVIAAGSLLGVALHQGVSYPVGKVDLLQLYPMSFREFLYAMDEKQLADALLSHDFKLIDGFSQKYIYYLKIYYYVGGMPEVVKSFSVNGDFNEVRKIQKNILSQYRGDFGKHVSAHELPRINLVWDSIPMQLAKENKKFFFGKIKSGARSSEFEIAIQWLLDSGLIHKVYKVNEPHLPLVAYKDFSSYKIFILDVGLLCAMTDLDATTILKDNELFVEFKGALTEQYVLQELLSSTPYCPFYYGTEKSTFEQDFIIQKDNCIVPIEVKAATNVRSQSLKAFYEKFTPKMCIRFSLLPYIKQEWLENIPLYAVCSI